MSTISISKPARDSTYNSERKHSGNIVKIHNTPIFPSKLYNLIHSLINTALEHKLLIKKILPSKRRRHKSSHFHSFFHRDDSKISLSKLSSLTFLEKRIPLPQIWSVYFFNRLHS